MERKKVISDVLQAIKNGKMSPEEGHILIQSLKKVDVKTEVKKPEEKDSDIAKHSDTEYKCVLLKRPSNINNISIEKFEPKDPEENEVQILVKAFSLNFGDLLCIKGLYPTMPEYPFTPGFEVSGIVIKAGKNVKSFKHGDEVIAVTGAKLGGHSSIVNTSEKLVIKKPRNVSFEEACAFPIVFLTAYHIFDRAGIKKGEKVLIQTAAGGVGLAAVQLALLKGVEVFATAGSAKKLDFLAKMGVKNLINYREEDFEKRIMEMTGNSGVNVVINTLSGDAIQKGLNVLAPEGRYVEIAMTGLKAAGGLDLSNLVRNQTFMSIDLRRLLLNRPEEAKEYLGIMSKYLEDKKVRPTIAKVFSYNEITDAYRYMENRENIGKVVVATGVNMKQNTHRIEQKMSDSMGANGEIAVIGMSCRLPGANSIEEFWNNLQNGISSIIEVPKERWDVEKYYDPDPYRLDKTYSKWGGYIENIDMFDSMFFNLSGKEAEMTDPQQRIFLEEGWKALEDAGYANESISDKKCSVFVGVGNSDYMVKMMEEGVEAEPQSLWGTESSILPARLSYFLNLKGPSVAVNTACSSSLVAIHLACQSILNGESEMAVAGGAFIAITPYFYIASSNAGMLSPEGKCKTFDNSADGFVPGEGVGVVVLKSLNAALRDGDNIYGIIKGSGINQDGKTNGITAPSTLSQTELELEVYKKCDINPETINYVETHGTGTKLGDPIEIEALTNAFRKYTDKKQFCAVGSVKTNIGHTSAAAGVSSVIKVLLALKNGKIPPSLNFKEENKHINFTDSPFYVNSQLKEWNSKSGYPKRAAVSSFGFSGTNAHLVIEEPPQVDFSTSKDIKTNYFIPVSAKSEASLKGILEDMCKWLEDVHEPSLLAHISYTLCARRSHFAVRTALVADSLDTLKLKLKEAVQKSDFYNTGNQSSKQAGLLNNSGVLFDGICSMKGDEPEYGEKLNELLELYLKGYNFKWNKMFESGKYYNLPMPTYHFERERYWIPVRDEKLHGEEAACSLKLHPLIGKNTSTFEEQKYTTTFDGNEFYFSDHRIGDNKVLPGVTYLEMARVAGEMAGMNKVKVLKDIVWASPIICGEKGIQVNISLFPQSGNVGYEIWTDTNNFERTVHAQGRIVYENADMNTVNQCVDINKAKKSCEIVKTASECYEVFNRMGISYGAAFRGIQELYCSEKSAVSKFELPDGIDNNAYFVLNPAIMDTAIQTLSGLVTNQSSQSHSLYLPFSLETVELIRPLTSRGYAVAEIADGSSPELKKYDIKILDEDGNLLVYMKRLSVRLLNKQNVSNSKLMMYKDMWKDSDEIRASGSSTPEEIIIFDTDTRIRDMILEVGKASGKKVNIRLVKKGLKYKDKGDGIYEINPAKREDYGRLLKDIKLSGCNGSTIVHLWSRDTETQGTEKVKEQLHDGFYSIMFLTQALMEQKYKEARLIYAYQYSEDVLLPNYSGIGSMASCIRMENPLFDYTTVGLDIAGTEPDVITQILINELSANGGKARDIIYEGATRKARIFEEVEGLSAYTGEFKDFCRQNGVYIISGGAGGLGLIIARYLAEQVKARIVLLGRSELLGEKEETVLSLKKTGAQVTYFKADVSERTELQKAIEEVRRLYGGINGVIHCAGVIRDSFIIKKTVEEAACVLAPKVIGTILLDELTSTDDLDFFITFSSLAAVTGNIGQSDYAFSNSFMDYFAKKREKMRLKGNRKGKTVSINWPLWDEGTMTLDEQGSEWIRETMGLVPLGTGNGLSALGFALESGNVQVAVLEGEENTVRSSMVKVNSDVKQNVTSVKTLDNLNNVMMKEKVAEYLKNIVSKETRLPSSKISAEEPMEKYGIDSAMIINLTRTLEKDFGELSKTLFFEYRSLGELSAFLTDNYIDRLTEMFGIKGKENQLKENKIKSVEGVNPQRTEKELTSFRRTRFVIPSEEAKINPDTAPQEIAIIGVSGRYPLADSLDEFWENLKSGKDCITEIPKDRWEYGKYYSKDRNVPGKVHSKWGGFINDVDKFDPMFFNISPREAELLDPQERLFLETVWHAVEDSGYTRAGLSKDKVGVFVGVMYGHYQLFAADEHYTAAGIPASSFASVANRVSYFFDFHGPSIAVDTMCSSSLTALHLAARSILAGECSVAVAGGVNVSIHPNKYLLLGQGNFASSDGRCRSFGDGGDGYVPGEGVGAVLLKPLEKAVEDGDYIYGVIKGSTMNHGGKTNGYTVPNPTAQAELIEVAIKKAGINPRTLSYIEAHGTGTFLGDPIEITGLTNAIGGSTKDKQFCAIGSVKSNIGHLESAAGIAGLTKVLLQMKYKQLVPSLHSKDLNPNINFKDSPFYVQQNLKEWKKPVISENGLEQTYPRRAGISAFGAGGSNVHIIVEEWEKKTIRGGETENDGSQIIVLSAKDEERLKEYALRLADFLDKVQKDDKNINLRLQDIAYTLQVGREAMDARLALVISDIKEIPPMLRGFASGTEIESGVFTGNAKTSIVKSGLINGGRAGSEFINIIIKDRELSRLAELWVYGVEVDWRLLYKDCAVYRIPLPVYPFNKERYWAFEKLATVNIRGTVRRVSPLRIKQRDNVRKTAAVNENMLERVMEDLRNAAAAVLKVNPDKLDLDENLGNFGFESITLKELADNLSSIFSTEVSPALFFSHNSIKALGTYLIKEYGEKLRNYYSKQVSEEIADFTETSTETDFTYWHQNTYSSDDDSIAVVGMSGRFPGSPDLESFWINIERETDLITEVPPERWDWRNYYGKDVPEKLRSVSKWGGFINDVDKFDPRFFNISPLEAEMMDPQQRLFLETVWNTIEDAGYKASELSGRRVGLFAGVQFNDYQQMLAEDGELNPLMGTGNEHSILVNRISYLLNFNGPSEPYNTACSSSLVAIHRAINSIRSGESELAIAGGISLMLSPYSMVSASQMGILSPDGRCKTLDKSANGYVKGEGVGALMLKPLSKAVKDGDHVYAVIKGSAVNHGGRANSLTAPNSEAQAALLVKAYEEAGISPDTVTYLELHGTGTELGDPVEIEGIKSAFKQLSESFGLTALNDGYCGISSVKTNIGHLEPAAGIAGIIKVILSLKNKKIPGILHLKELNPYINIKNSPFYIVKNTQEWKPIIKSDDEVIPRRAGVSSFGFGGVNAHVVLEEYNGSNSNEYGPVNNPCLFILSAKNEDRLKEYAVRIVEFLESKYKNADSTFGSQVELENQLKNELLFIASEIIKVNKDDIQGQEDLQDLGFDTVGLTKFAEEISKKFGIEINTNDFLGSRSIKNLSEFLLENYYSDISTTLIGNSNKVYDKGISLVELTYTLQVGREEMNERIACSVCSVEELIVKLKSYLQGEASISNFFSGSIMKSSGDISIAPDSNRVKEILESGNMDLLASAWVKGAKIDWTLLYEGFKPNRISIPTYPFARETYWAPKGIRQKAGSGAVAIQAEEVSGDEAEYTEVTDEINDLEYVKIELKKILSEKLKLDFNEIKDNVVLAEYGVDSMLSSIIIQVVQEKFEIQLSVNAIAEYPTIYELAKYITSEFSIERKATSEVKNVKKVRQNQSAKSSTPKLPPEILPINPKGNRQISFWAHGAAGYSTFFKNLSQELGPDYPIYAFQARGTDGKSIPQEFNVMVDHYIECVRMVQPKGPYFLGGYSFGGLIAMEMARKLHEQGEKISHLVMFDTYPATDEVNNRFYATYDPDFLKLYLVNAFLKVQENPELCIKKKDLEGIPQRLQVGYLAKLAKEKGNKLIEVDEIYNYIKGGLTVSDYSEETYLVHKPQPYYASDVLFLKSTNGFVGKDNYLGFPHMDILKEYDYIKPWKELIKTNMNVVVVNSDHNHMLDQPSLPHAAVHIEKLLKGTLKIDRDKYEEFRESFMMLAKFGHRLLVDAFWKMGVLKTEGEKYSKEELKKKMSIIPEYNRLFAALLDIMEREGFIKIKGQNIITTEQISSAELIKEVEASRSGGEELGDRYPQIKSYIPLLTTCCQAYSDVLTGKVNHMEVIFPNGSMDLVADIYKGNIQTDYYNQLTAQMVKDYASKKLRKYPNAQVNILEVGAGTGGTSTLVLEAIKEFGSKIRFVYTDISSGFVQFGMQEFGSKYPFTEFKTLNIENDPEAQGFEPGSFDLIFCSNVLHTTARMDNTLRQVKCLLKADGLLLINEITSLIDYNTLTFGLTTGWWLFEDEEIRLKGSPLLTTDKWREKLQETGFKEVEILGTPDTREEDLPQSLIIAKK